MTTCDGSAGGGWEANNAPQPVRLLARMVSLINGQRAEAHVTIPIARRRFKIDLNLQKNSDEIPGQVPAQWTATATTDYSFNGTPYRLIIRQLDGWVVAACMSPFGLGLECAGSMSAGTVVRATMEDVHGRVYGRSPYYQVTATEAKRLDVGGLDLAILASRFLTARQICDILLTYPKGSHAGQSTVSDQWLACDGAATAGMTPLQTLLAIAGTGGVAGAGAAWYVISQIETDTPAPPTGPYPPPEPPVDPTDPPAPPLPLPWMGEEWGAEDIAAELMRRNVDNPELTQTRADTIARQCERLAGRAGLIPQEECVDAPIFAPGADVEEATKHDLDALFGAPPQPFTLHYMTPGNDRGWLSTSRAMPECPSPRPTGQECDEYPFASAQEGGELHGPSLRLIDSDDNRSEGVYLKARVYDRCGMVSGDPYIVVPTPPSLGVPTLGLCNRR